MIERGKLIVIDGADGSGKATQTQLLVNKLHQLQISCQTIDFPGYTRNKAGQMIRQYLSKAEGFRDLHPKLASLIYAADRWFVKDQFNEWLNNGNLVICDRYTTANEGHQTARLPAGEREEYLKWLREFEYVDIGLPRPDLVYYLFVNPEISQAKVIERVQNEGGEQPDLHEGDIDHLKTSTAIFWALSQREPNWVAIECLRDGALKPREEIHQNIMQVLVDRGIVKL